MTTVYVADGGNNRIEVYSSSGPSWTTIGGTASGSGLGQFNDPTGVALDASGDLYVAEYVGARIQEYNGSSWSVVSLGSGTSAGYFTNPWGLGFDGNGNLFVTDTANRVVQQYVPGTATWTILPTYFHFFSLLGVEADTSGNLYVADIAQQLAYKYNGSTWSVFAGTNSPGNANGQFHSAAGVAVDSGNHVFIADYSNNRIQEFDTSGNYLNQFGNTGGSGQLSLPQGVAVDNLGNVYVADQGNERIAVFTYVP